MTGRVLETGSRYEKQYSGSAWIRIRVVSWIRIRIPNADTDPAANEISSKSL
jgi:hypothetical protein